MKEARRKNPFPDFELDDLRKHRCGILIDIQRALIRRAQKQYAKVTRGSKDTFTWVLDWGNAKTLYDLLKKEFVEPFLGAQVAVVVAVTLHDEYSDRFYTSHTFRLELVLAECYSLSGSRPSDKS